MDAYQTPHIKTPKKLIRGMFTTHNRNATGVSSISFQYE